MQQITVQELHDNWVIDNPLYEFFFNGLKIKKVESVRGNSAYYALIFYTHQHGLAFKFSKIEIRPKTAHPTELQDPSELDATLPIIPAETAQRDHDEIQRLLGENAKMRGVLIYVQSLAPDVSAAYYPDREKSLYVDNFKQIGEQIKKMLEGLS